MTQDARLVTIRAGELALDLAPEAGGTIAGLAWRGFEVLRRTDPIALAARDPRGSACFPMVPYCGRIAHGRFPFDGRDRQLALNFAPQPHSIHGTGWRRAWDVTAQDASSATLALDHVLPRDGAEHWPWPYRAVQRFAVTGNRLHATMTVTNAGAAPFPAAVGFHPYFPRTRDVRLTAKVSGMWLQDPTLKPTEHVKLPAEYPFPSGLAMDPVRFDKCLTGWDGTAVIEWPEARMRATMTSPGTRHLVVYTPPEPAIMCVEPQSIVPDAFNLHARGVPDTGYAVLQPGEKLSIAMNLELASIA